MRRNLALVITLAVVWVHASVPATAAQAQAPAPAQNGGVCPTALPHPFTDIGGNAHEAAIACLVWREVTFGATPTTYVPGAAVNRGQMAAFVIRALVSAGVDVPAPTEQGFTDIAGSVHAREINQLAAIGITVGTAPTTFAPRQDINRGQMAAFLARTYHFVTGGHLSVVSHPFTDVTDRNAHGEDIARAYGAALTVGVTSTTYRPHAPVRRDQMASFLVRLLGALPEVALPDRPDPTRPPAPPAAPDPEPGPDPDPDTDPPVVPTVCDETTCGWIDDDQVVLATRTVTPFPDDGYVTAGLSMSNYGWAAHLYDVFDFYLWPIESRGDRGDYYVYDGHSWANGYDALCRAETRRSGLYLLFWFAADCVGNPSQFHVDMASNYPGPILDPSPSRGTWAMLVQHRDAEQPHPPPAETGLACRDDAAGDVRDAETGAVVSASYMDVTEFCVGYDAHRVRFNVTFAEGAWPADEDIAVYWEIDTIGDPREARVDFGAGYAGGDAAFVVYALYPDRCDLGHPEGYYPSEWCWFEIDQAAGYLHLSFPTRFLTDMAWPYDGHVPHIRVRMTVSNEDRGYIDEAPEGRRWWWEDWLQVTRRDPVGL